MRNFKKTACFLAVAVFATLPLGACGKGSGGGSSKSDVFDENNIVLSFSAMSDVHQQRGKQSYSDKLTHALQCAAELNGGPLDLALFAGDLTENTWTLTGKEGESDFTTEYNIEIEMLKNAISAGVDLDKTAVFYALGNHDTDSKQLGEEIMSQTPALFYNMLGEEFFRADANDSLPEKGLRHAVVNGYHFLAVNPDSYWKLNGYTQETLDWLDGQLKAITKKDPNRYVFVTGHPPVYETVWGSFAKDWSDLDIASVCEKYPQVFYLSGHIHNVLNEDTQVSQNGYFTQVDCGGVRATGMMNQLSNVNGTKFDNAISGMHDNDFSQGLLVQADVNGNVRVIRCNYITESPIRDPWEFSHPKSDLSHLMTYDNETRAAQNEAPMFADDAAITATKNGDAVTFTWDAADDDDMVRYYKLYLYKAGESRYTAVYNLSTFSYKYDRIEDMPDEMSYARVMLDLAPGEYRVECMAIDIWDARSNKISATFSL